MNTSQEDIQLIQGVLNNDSNSQNKLYDKYTIFVKNFLKKNYTTYHDLDDDVSEILIKIFLGLHTFNPTKSSFTSWVCTVAKNHMIDKWRNNDISYVLTSNTFGNYITSSTTYVNNYNTETINNTDQPFFTTISSSSSCEYEMCNTTSYVTSELSSCDCTFLEMKYIYGYDYAEIGSEFNISSTTVSNRVNYIKHKLKKYKAEVMD